MTRRKPLLYVVLSLLLSLLVACDSVSVPFNESEGEDPLVSQQWALHNSAQTAYAEQAGVAGEDINGFSALPLTLANYANGMTGQNVELAILDTGLEINHPDLFANVLPRGSFNFADPDGLLRFNPTNLYQEDGDHGTSVAGIAAARGNNSLGMMGVAPKARLRGFNILSYGDLDAELAAYGVYPYYGLDASSVSVFNKSYGTNPVQVETNMETEQTLAAMKLATEQLRGGKGAIFVKAAGNEYNQSVGSSPSGWCRDTNELGLSCYNVNQETENATPYQMLIGAFNAQGTRSSYSNTGSALWLVAPGGEAGTSEPAIIATDQIGCDQGYSQTQDPLAERDFDEGQQGFGNENCDFTSLFDGTSAATPIVSGAVALILEAHPNSKWHEVKHILASTARKIQPDLATATMTLEGQSFELEPGWVTNTAGFHFSNEFGFGALDVLAAVEKAQNWTASDALPSFKVGNPVVKTLSQTIPDASATGVQQTLSLTDTMTVQTLELTLSIEALEPSEIRKDNKIDASDYWVQVTSPSGTQSVLLTPFNAYLSGYALPNLRLVSHAFYGEPAQGNWTVRVVDVDGSTKNFINHKGEGRLTTLKLRVYGY